MRGKACPSVNVAGTVRVGCRGFNAYPRETGCGIAIRLEELAEASS
jgi:hypothetical protein